MPKVAEERFPTDPSGIDEPHDVLAAEEFAMPTRDDRHPPDPTGLHEPHDVLAAEEHAMPAPDQVAAAHGAPGGSAGLQLALMGAAAALVAFLVRRRRR